MEERLARVGRTAWWITGAALVAGLVGLIFWTFRVIFPPLVLAGAIVFLLNPVVAALERRGLRRLFGTAIAFLGVVVLFGVLGAVLYPLIANQSSEVSERWPELKADAEDWIDDLSRRSDRDDWPIHLPSVSEIEDETSSGDEPELADQVATLREYLTRVFHVGIIFVLGPFLAFYLLIDLPDVHKRVDELIPARIHDEVDFIAHRLNLAIGGFFRGQLAVALIVGVMASIGLKLVVDLPLWLVVGMVAGVFNMIPLIGPYVGAIPGIVVALATKDVRAAVGVALVMVVVQQIDNHFITPTVMRRAVQLHPAAVMIALLAWGTIGGFFGLLLAVPLTAALKIIGGHLWRKWVVGVSLPGLDEPFPDDPASPDAAAGMGGKDQPGPGPAAEAHEDVSDADLDVAEATEAAATTAPPARRVRPAPT